MVMEVVGNPGDRLFFNDVSRDYQICGSGASSSSSNSSCSSI